MQSEQKARRPILKWVIRILGGLIGLILIAVISVFVITNRQFSTTYDITPANIAIPTDADALAEGARLAITRGCTDCHGENLAGNTIIEDPALGNIYGSNLTAGEGGIGSTYSADDFVTAIRHGVKPDGSPTLFMPSLEYYTMNDADIGALVAYIQSVPAVDNVVESLSVGPVGRGLWLGGQLPILVSAASIPHDAPRPEVVPVGATVDYGEYLAQSCLGCHTPSFKGGPVPGSPPDFPPASDLTSTGNISDYTLDDYTTLLRTGVRPDSSLLHESMPWQVTTVMTDEELGAMYLFFNSLD